LQDLGPSSGAERQYAYMLRGVGIEQSALSAPYDALSAQQHGAAWPSNVTHNFGRVDSVEQCLPLMVKRPVRCVADAHVSLDVAHSITVSSKDGKCKLTSPSFRHHPPHAPATVLGACTDGHEIGRATILFGAYGLHARALQTLLQDGHGEQKEALGIQCTVDIPPSIAFREVILKPRNTNRFDEPASISALFGDCTPSRSYQTTLALSDVLTHHALATMAGASWQLLAENYYDDGWPATLYRLASRDSGTPFEKSFNDSTNALEDALGIASAVAMSSFYGTNSTSGTLSLEIHGDNVCQNMLRLGPGINFSLHAVSVYLLEIILLATGIYLASISDRYGPPSDSVGRALKRMYVSIQRMKRR
jgi:hypothetical protein